jgi:hypothetical protein
MSQPDSCPRCGGTEFREIECGADTCDSPLFYSYECRCCELTCVGWGETWREGTDEFDEAFPPTKWKAEVIECLSATKPLSDEDRALLRETMAVKGEENSATIQQRLALLREAYEMPEDADADARLTAQDILKPFG